MLLFVSLVLAIIGVAMGQDDPYTSDFVLDHFCMELAQHRCDFPDKLICASDGRTYSNLCQFQKARCVFREIDFKDFGACPDGDSS